MSWSEVAKLQEGQRDRLFNDMYILETSQTWTAPHNGYYKIICVGAGGNAQYYTSSNYGAGFGGGVAVKTKRLKTGATLTIDITGGTATCDGMVASLGDETKGGTATGGEYNYTGLSGHSMSSGITSGGSVGCMLSGLMFKDKDVTSRQVSYGYATEAVPKGFGLMGHGGGGGCAVESRVREMMRGEPACVIIIPLESI